jgi:hypothetical protein
MTDRGMMSGMGMPMGGGGGGMMNMPMMGGMGMMGGMMMPGSGMMAGAMPGMMMAPRCTIAMERCPGGMRMTCTCEDKTSAAMLGNLMMMMQNGMCSCYMMMNGMPMCVCNVGMMGVCKVEMMEMGCTITCTSGDKHCEKMIQSCCDCMMGMMMPGMTCCVMMNGMPVACMMM